MTKVLVLDSCGFRGIRQESLKQKARNHCIVLSYVMAVESLATQSGDAPMLLHMFQDLIRHGAYYGRSPLKIDEEERRNLSRAKTIIDLNRTELIKNNSFNDDTNYLRAEAESYNQSLIPIVEVVIEMAETLYNNIEQQNRLREMRQEENILVRLKKWTEAVDAMSEDFMLRYVPDLISHWTCKWYIWHNVRLRWILAFEWACRKAQCGNMPPLNRAIDDFHDMQHVSYLAIADGLLTRDENLVEPLAKAAFPDKDLFRDLSEVTTKYRFIS